MGLIAIDAMKDRQRSRRGQPVNTRSRSAVFGSWATIRDLEVLCAVIKHGGYSAAARELGISQPAVSRSMAQVERLSGRKMFERLDGRLSPSADALSIYEESTRIFQGLERLENFRWTEELREGLNLALPPTLAHCLLVGLLPEFMAVNPSLRINLEIRTTLDVVSMVAESAADLGIGEIPAGDWSVRRLPFRRSILAVAMPEGHPLAALKKIGAEHLSGQPMILQVRRNPIRSQIDRLLKSGRDPVNMVVETSNALSAVQLVERGLGISVVNPFPVMNFPQPGVVYRPFEPEVWQETCFILPVNRPLRGITKRFIEFVQKRQPANSRLSRAI
jgi:DNA-binding transcriptional LysR family regulator